MASAETAARRRGRRGGRIMRDQKERFTSDFSADAGAGEGRDAAEEGEDDRCTTRGDGARCDGADGEGGDAVAGATAVVVGGVAGVAGGGSVAAGGVGVGSVAAGGGGDGVAGGGGGGRSLGTAGGGVSGAAAATADVEAEGGSDAGPRANANANSANEASAVVDPTTIHFKRRCLRFSRTYGSCNVSAPTSAIDAPSGSDGGTGGSVSGIGRPSSSSPNSCFLATSDWLRTTGGSLRLTPSEAAGIVFES